MNPLIEVRTHKMKMQRTRGGHYPGSPSTAPHRTVPSPIKSSSSTPSITRSSKCSVGPGAALARALGESFQHSHSLQKHDATRTSGDGPRAVAGGGGPPGGVAGRTRMGHVNEHEGAKATSRVTLALPWMHPLRIGDAHTEASPRPQHNAFFRSTPPAFNISPLPSRDSTANVVGPTASANNIPTASPSVESPSPQKRASIDSSGIPSGTPPPEPNTGAAAALARSSTGSQNRVASERRHRYHSGDSLSYSHSYGASSTASNSNQQRSSWLVARGPTVPALGDRTNTSTSTLTNSNVTRTNGGQKQSQSAAIERTDGHARDGNYVQRLTRSGTTSSQNGAGSQAPHSTQVRLSGKKSYTFSDLLSELSTTSASGANASDERRTLRDASSASALADLVDVDRERDLRSRTFGDILPPDRGQHPLPAHIELLQQRLAATADSASGVSGVSGVSGGPSVSDSIAMLMGGGGSGKKAGSGSASGFEDSDAALFSLCPYGHRAVAYEQVERVRCRHCQYILLLRANLRRIRQKCAETPSEGLPVLRSNGHNTHKNSSPTQYGVAPAHSSPATNFNGTHSTEELNQSSKPSAVTAAPNAQNGQPNNVSASRVGSGAQSERERLQSARDQQTVVPLLGTTQPLLSRLGASTGSSNGVLDIYVSYPDRSAIHRPAVGSTPLALKDSGFLQIRGVPSAQAKPAPVVPRPTRRPDTLRTHTLIQSQAKPKLGSTTNTQKIFSDEGLQTIPHRYEFPNPFSEPPYAIRLKLSEMTNLVGQTIRAELMPPKKRKKKRKTHIEAE